MLANAIFYRRSGNQRAIIYFIEEKNGQWNTAGSETNCKDSNVFSAKNEPKSKGFRLFESKIKYNFNAQTQSL